MHLYMKIIWNDEMLLTLRELFPTATNAAIAARLGIGTRTVARKASELGLEKAHYARRDAATAIILANFGHQSYSELSRMAGVSVRTVIRIVARHGLARAASDSSCFISARRREIVRRERLRMRIGLDPLTKVKVTSDRRRVCLRNRLKQSGYIVQRGSDIIYFAPDIVRNTRREDTGASLGLVFRPLPETYNSQHHNLQTKCSEQYCLI